MGLTLKTPSNTYKKVLYSEVIKERWWVYMALGDYLVEARRGINIKRYNRDRRNVHRSVGEHTWFVSVVTQCLGLWERDKFNNSKFNMERALSLAINHDMAESYLGDVLGPTKNYSESIRKSIDNAELDLVDTVIREHLPRSWGDFFFDMHSEIANKETVESRIVKAADLIDRLYENMEEIVSGSRAKRVIDIIENDVKELLKFKEMSVRYFIKYPMMDIGKLDGICIRDFIGEGELDIIDSWDFSKYF